MANKSFRQAADSRLSSLTMSPALRETILEAAEQEPRHKRPIRFKRAILTAVAACLVLVVGLSVAASFPSFEIFISNMGEEIRSLVVPINGEVEQQGLHMEVVAALHDGNTAVIFLTVQDKQGSRVDEATVLEDISFGDDSYVIADQVHFDPATGVATYRLEANGGPDEFRSKKLSLTVGSVLLGSEWHEDEYTGFTLADVMANYNPSNLVYAENVDNSTYSYGESDLVAKALENKIQNSTLPVLRDEPLAKAHNKLDWLPLNNIGVVEGMLHVQLKAQNEADTFLDTYLWLEYPGKPDFGGLTVASYGLETDENLSKSIWYERYSRIEYVLETPHGADPAEVKLYATGNSYEDVIYDDWSFTVTLEEEGVEYSWDVNIDLGGWWVYQLQLSPLGVTALATGDDDGEQWLEIYAYNKQGDELEFYSSYAYWDWQNNIVKKDGFANLVDPSSIGWISVNGINYYLEDAQHH